MLERPRCTTLVRPFEQIADLDVLQCTSPSTHLTHLIHTAIFSSTKRNISSVYWQRIRFGGKEAE